MHQTAQKAKPAALDKSLRPLCPRDGRVMTYEAAGIQWRDADGVQSLPSYRCGFMGCSVRYRPNNGYFTVVDVPDVPYFLEEPGVNRLRCPIHLSWLCRNADRGATEAKRWRCGAEGCGYVHPEA
jgi:hypothetical protein